LNIDLSFSSGWSFFDRDDYDRLMAEWDRDSNQEESESDHSDLFDDLEDYDFSFMESDTNENGASCSAVLPKDVRTLKKSIRKVTDIKDVPPGRYFHFGVVQGFITVLEHHFDLNNVPNLMEIYISFDGMPLTNSAKKKFVPVTATLVNIIICV